MNGKYKMCSTEPTHGRYLMKIHRLNGLHKELGTSWTYNPINDKY